MPELIAATDCRSTCGDSVRPAVAARSSTPRGFRSRRPPLSSPSKQNDGKSSLDHALTDGEDFELILAVPPSSAQQMLADQPFEQLVLTDIGEFVSDQTLLQRDGADAIQPLLPAGFEHHFT